MEEWKEYKLGEVAQIQTGPFGSQLHQSDYVDDGVPCIMPTNIGKNLDIISDGIVHISENDAQRLSRHIVNAGDIIYARRGDIEKCAYIKEQQNGWFCGTGCLRIRINKDADSHFIAYQLSTAEAKSWIVGNAVGTTMLNLNSSILSDLPILLPSLSTQRHITAILKSFDDKIEVNRRINDNLEQQAQALFKSWFVDFEPFRDQPFVESELGMIPEGWRVGNFMDYINVMPGGTPSTSVAEYWENGTIPFFSPKDVHGVYCFDTEKHITEYGLDHCASKLYPKDTLFITARGTVGKIALAAVPMAMNQSNYALVAKGETGKYYLYLLTQTLVSLLLKKANGAVFSAITTKDLNEKVVFPPNGVISRFEDIIKPMFDKLHSLTLESRCLASLRDTLLPRLMSGELKVNDMKSIAILPKFTKYPK